MGKEDYSIIGSDTSGTKGGDTSDEENLNQISSKKSTDIDTSVTKGSQPIREVDERATNPNVRKVIRLWLAFNFFIAPIRDGLNPFVSVYLVAIVGLSPGIAGLIWFIRDVTTMFSQIPFGILADTNVNKKYVILLCTSVCTIAPLSIIWTSNIPILIVKTILEGFGSSGLGILKGPFTLGIAGHGLFDKTSKNTEIVEHTGAFFAALLAGIVAYILYPDVAPLFGVIGVFGFTAALCILLMPTYSTPSKDGSKFIIVDNNLARNSIEPQQSTAVNNEKELNTNDDMACNDNAFDKNHEEDVESNSKMLKQKSTGQGTEKYNVGNEMKNDKSLIVRVEEENDEIACDDNVSEEDHEEDIESKAKVIRETSSRQGVVKGDVENDKEKNEVAIDRLTEDEEPLALGCILSNVNILLFAIAIFLFHLGNAAILPLLGQAVARESGRGGIPYTAANIVIAQVSSIGAAYLMDYAVEKGVKINIPIQIGFSSQGLRIGIILVLIHYWPNPQALVATQILDGLGAGVNGLAIMLITKALTKGTNRFGLVFSAIHFFGACGGALSNLISGFIVDATSYEGGFIFLLCPIVLSTLLLQLLKVNAYSNEL